MDHQLNRMAGVSHRGQTFTAKQGQYLTCILLYTLLHRRSPAEIDMQDTSASVPIRFTRWC